MESPARRDAPERAAAAKALRERVPRSSHALWTPPPERTDPVETLQEAAAGRIPELLPIRHERMSVSAFAYFRGAAAVMAADLAGTPVCGFDVQLCGDAHCLNFGGFGTPERNLIFDINDFDETYPGPWEWDIKRLAVSLVLAARELHLKEAQVTAVVLAGLQRYRQRMLECAALPALDAWYAKIDEDLVIAMTPDPAARKRREALAAGARDNTALRAREKLTVVLDGRRRFRDEPPLLYHPHDAAEGWLDMTALFANYADSLHPHVRVLYNRYELVDTAIKVVGVGSIGTRCAVALFAADDDDSLILQVKEAVVSALEPHLPPAPVAFANQGERVVYGQLVMQSASDALLGFASFGGRDFYVRQYRDMKGSADVDVMDVSRLTEYGEFCAWALANAHARSGDAVSIAAYLGKGDQFDKAVAAFSKRYADQTQADFEHFVEAVKADLVPPVSST
jgi:uncharacterized protein (DUF2252 family)